MILVGNCKSNLTRHNLVAPMSYWNELGQLSKKVKQTSLVTWMRYWNELVCLWI
jgi:hypothetical protein